MSSRRKFLLGLGLSAGAFFVAGETQAGRCRRLRRRSSNHAIETERDEVADPEKALLQPGVIQPDYTKWKQVRRGMTEAEVESLLGPPLHKQPSKAPKPLIIDPEYFIYSWTYGKIVFADRVMPGGYSFSVDFRKGKVEKTLDPFQGRFSSDGRPSTPLLVFPYQDVRFHHYPQFIDFRWQPSSGKYPIQYVVEVDYHGWTSKGYKYIKRLSKETHLPQVSIIYPSGASPGRWRVKAVNELGESEWSPYRKFVFGGRG